jgi:hypothetical protein
MAGACIKPDCHPEDTGCHHEGCDILRECKNYRPEGEGQELAATVPGAADTEYFARVPWTGASFGLQDLSVFAATTTTIVVGIAGMYNAGKTTYLATLYCLLRQGVSIGDYRFAGSRTLIGWENLAWYLSWKKENNISFPPHTSLNAGRVPGLLHLSLKNSTGDRRELILTDAPGEWFDHWATKPSDIRAEGARWIHHHADAFLLFADCQLLADIEELGNARRQIRSIADRLKANLDDRPLGLIWSKSDVTIDPVVKKQISAHLQNSAVAHYREFQTSVRKGDRDEFHQGVTQSIEWILSVYDSEVNVLSPLPIVAPNDLFLAKR